MANLDWNSPYIDRRMWVLDHLDQLHVDANEALVLLLIDMYNQQHINIDHEHIQKKLKTTAEEVEAIFCSLTEKGYLTIDFEDNQLIFSIEGVFQDADIEEKPIQRSLLEEFEMEFRRDLSPYEMQRILDLSSTYDERRVRCALNEAAGRDKRNIDYIERILMTWMQKGYTIEQLENGIR